jgi:hypothetical protein
VLPHGEMFPNGMTVASRKCSLQNIESCGYGVHDVLPCSRAVGEAERQYVMRCRSPPACRH